VRLHGDLLKPLNQWIKNQPAPSLRAPRRLRNPDAQFVRAAQPGCLRFPVSTNGFGGYSFQSVFRNLQASYYPLMEWLEALSYVVMTVVMVSTIMAMWALFHDGL